MGTGKQVVFVGELNTKKLWSLLATYTKSNPSNFQFFTYIYTL